MSKLKAFQDTFDIQKKTGYKFNKWIFRAAFLVIVAFFIVAWYQDGFGMKQHIFTSCPKDAPMPCINEMYNRCDNLGLSWQLEWLKDNKPTTFNNYMKEVYGWCDIEYLQPGETYGTKPTFIQSYFISICFVLLGIALWLNHILYNKDYKGGADNEKPKDDLTN